MLDIYPFINSADIRKYLKDQEYQFSTAECAWLIYNSHTTLEQQFRAYDQMVCEMPDCEIKKRYNCDHIKSLLALIEKDLSVKKELLSRFYESENNCVFTYEYSYLNKRFADRVNNFLHTSYDSLYESLMADIKNEENEENEEIDKVRISKRKINSDDYTELELNNRLEPIRLYAAPWPKEACLDHNLEGMWFNFPTPFQKGDILWDPHRDGGKNKTDNIVVALNAEFKVPSDDENSRYRQYMKNGDITDMCLDGYIMCSHGYMYRDQTLTYMDYEFYRGELDGIKRQFKLMSDFLKGKIDEEVLSVFSHQIMMEEYLKDTRPDWFTDELTKEYFDE